MRRTSQLVGLDFSTGRAISPLPVDDQCGRGRTDFHDLSPGSTKAQTELPTASSHLRVREAPLASLGSWQHNRRLVEQDRWPLCGQATEDGRATSCSDPQEKPNKWLRR